MRLNFMEADVYMTVEISDENTSVIVEVRAYNAVYSYSLDFSGRLIDEAVISYARNKYDLLIGKRTAEAIRREIGSAYPLTEPLTMQIHARHLTEGTPRTVVLLDEEIREALADSVKAFVSGIQVVLEQIPKEYIAGITERGILLKGGEMLKNIARRLSIETNLPVTAIK